jgi:hypothetical protein
MADPEDPFLARWSRRKRSPHHDRPVRDTEPGRRDSDALTDASAEDKPPAAVAEPGVAEPGVAEPGTVAEELPDIDSLDKTSDFTVFLKEGVPEAIRRKALRRLWRTDPVLANLDGLNDYDEDFSALGMVTEHLKTIYKVGKGYLDEDEVPGAETPGDEVSVAQSAGESSEAGKDDPGEGAGAERASPEPDSPEPDSPQTESPAPDSPETAGPSSVAGDNAPRPGKLPSGKLPSGKLPSGKLPGRSALNRRWGGFAS